MTALTTIGPDAGVARRRVRFDGAGTNLIRTVRSEWTKIWSVRSTMWTLLSLVAVTVGASALFAWGESGRLARMSVAERATFDVTNLAMAGLAFGQLAIAVLGALIVTSEYSTGGIRTTLTAVPNRLRVLTAKGVVFVGIAAAVGMITSFAAFYVSMIFWSRHGMAAHLSDPGVLRAVLGGALYVVASGMFGFALGAILRHTAGAISAAVGLLFVAPPLTHLLPGSVGADISKYFTANAGQQITAVLVGPGQLAPWAGYLAFTLEWLLLLGFGAVILFRRDA
jgi:hypothetical protein